MKTHIVMERFMFREMIDEDIYYLTSADGKRYADNIAGYVQEEYFSGRFDVVSEEEAWAELDELSYTQYGLFEASDFIEAIEEGLTEAAKPKYIYCD